MAQLPPALSNGSVEQGRISQRTIEEERREQILAAITEVFAKRGYPSATVEHLIAGGKVSMGGFYNYFEGKEDCFVQAYERVIAQIFDRIREAVPADAEWQTQVTSGLRALVSYLVEQPLASRIVLLEAQAGGPEAVRRYNETLKQAAAFLRRGRAESREAEKLPESFEDATASGLVWLLQSRLARGELGDAAELYPQMGKVVLEPYLGRERAERALRDANDEHAASR
ncbi:MAG TPA: TetR/AcrR family transcriptional regulator [Solirubrobacterales bacterium]|nr:TetR/AcrR family transcriptional regulator [Solirubrobacterales bacterium]